MDVKELDRKLEKIRAEMNRFYYSRDRTLTEQEFKSMRRNIVKYAREIYKTAYDEGFDDGYCEACEFREDPGEWV